MPRDRLRHVDVDPVGRSSGSWTSNTWVTSRALAEQGHEQCGFAASAHAARRADNGSASRRRSIRRASKGTAG